jgi:acyl-CoA thioester hydrolase
VPIGARVDDDELDRALAEGLIPEPRRIPAPFSRARAIVRPEWIDYNGHMNVGYYHVAFDQAADVFLEFLGFTRSHREAHRVTTFALESHLAFLREVREGDRLRFEARLLDFDAKRVHFYQEMYHADQGYLAASCESLSVQVSLITRRSAPLDESLRARLAGIRAAHAGLERPWQIGHVISLRAPPSR